MDAEGVAKRRRTWRPVMVTAVVVFLGAWTVLKLRPASPTSFLNAFHPLHRTESRGWHSSEASRFHESEVLSFRQPPQQVAAALNLRLPETWQADPGEDEVLSVRLRTGDLVTLLVFVKPRDGITCELWRSYPLPLTPLRTWLGRNLGIRT